MFRWCKNSRTTDLEKTKSVVLNKTVKIDHLKFTSLTISPGTAAVTWLLIINLLLVQLQCLQRKSIMCFDRALYMAAYFSQTMAPLWSGCTGQHICLLCWSEAWILLGNNSRLVCGAIKNNGPGDHQNCIFIRPRSWGGFEQLAFWDFNWSMTTDRRKCASLILCCYHLQIIFFFKSSSVLAKYQSSTLSFSGG